MSAHLLDRLGSFTRLIRFDTRGSLFGYSEGGPVSILFAATSPERVTELVFADARAPPRG